MPVTASPTIWEALDSWSKEQHSWRQFIINIAASKGTLTPEQIDQAFELFLIDNKLKELPAGTQGPRVPPLLGRPVEALASKLYLRRVDGLSGINALPEGAALTFGPGLTIIFGQNGAGKTGFSRLLSNACFSRKVPPILKDVFAEGDVQQKARFHFSFGDAEQEPIDFPTANGSPLKRIAVFDTSVARHHLTESSAFSFRPTGFDAFLEIGRAYLAISQKLEEQIAAISKPNEFPKMFGVEGSPVYDAIVALGEKSDLTFIRKLAIFSDAEVARIKEIEERVAALKAGSSQESLNAIRSTKADAEKLAIEIARVESDFTEDATIRRNGLISNAVQTAEAAKAIGSETFKRPFFSAVGSKEWEVFARGVFGLAKAEGSSYPSEGMHCLLCERVLDEPSIKHISDLLAFVEGDARKAAEKALAELQSESTRLRNLNLAVFSEGLQVKAGIKRLDEDLDAEITAALAPYIARRDQEVRCLTNLEQIPATTTASAIRERLGTFIAGLATRISQIESDRSAIEIKALEDEKRFLRHREVLSKLLPEVEKFVSDAQWVKKATATKSLLNTKSVTDKEKSLTQSLITEGYRTRFGEECRRLNCKLPVGMETFGAKGETLRHLKMTSGHKPDEVLSEGEQRAIAIADFLTEAALNPASAGIVFDDPVSTLDDVRKDRIAERLVQESAERQVIIFTHDFVFLNQLTTWAGSIDGITLSGHWVQLDADDRPGHVSLDDSPITSKTAKTTDLAEKALIKCKALSGTAREAAIQEGMKHLRITLEETVVRTLFRGIVPRWSHRVIITSLSSVRWDDALADRIKDLFEELSALGGVHTRDDAGRLPELTPAILEQKIAEVKEILASAKPERKKT